MHHLLIAATQKPWAILPAKLDEISAFLQSRIDGRKAPTYTAAQAKQPVQSGSIAVLSVFGTLVPRANMISDYSGGTSAEVFTKNFRAMVGDNRIAAILLDVDSPGGSVQGIPELADEIRAARSVKPIAAVANHLMASAAYWIAAAAGEVAVSPSGEVGSVGVVAMHLDESAALQAEGIKPTIISAGKYKAELSSMAPLSAEAKAEVQRQVDYYHDQFVGSLARSRGVSPETVRKSYGQGRLVNARDALAAGMVDRIATFDEMVSRLSSPQGRAAMMKRRAESGAPVIRASRLDQYWEKLRSWQQN